MTTYARPNREDARVAMVHVDRLLAHPLNIRADLGDLRELAESIRHEGVLVPLMAERHGDLLRLLHGHRRWAAARIAGMAKVPVVIVPQHAPDQAISLMLAENTRRADLSAGDKRAAIAALHDTYGHTFADIAQRLGVSVATIHNWRGGAGPRPVRSASPAATTRRPRPQVKPSALHDLIQRWEGIASPELVEELRVLLGGWTPGSVSAVAS